MQSLQTGVASSLGSRMLAEIEDTSLDQILTSLRNNLATARTKHGDSNNNNNYDNGNKNATAIDSAPLSTALKIFPINQLNHLVKRHFRATQSAPLTITGRYNELLYLLVATLIAAPHEKAVAIIDFEGRFDPLRVLATVPFKDELQTKLSPVSGRHNTSITQHFVRKADLDHVHIMRPPSGDAAHTAQWVASVEEYMLYGDHPSRTREWWGTIVIGGGNNPAGNPSAAASAQLAVTAGWKGWLRVDRAQPDTASGFPLGTSLEEALNARENRQRLVENTGWAATCPWGRFTFHGNGSI
ncbi:hypothetical protein V8F20_003169 [Naviculisporaceae sp. PSN 640]